MRYLSVCSGIEAATVAWHPLGWQPAAFSEIEPFPASVLAHHYPTVPNMGDMTKFKEWNLGSIDLLVGGTPCQSFSVAGLRKGLADPRGNLMLTYLAIADQYRPRWLVWENVPGVLSSNGGRDFGTFLGGLGELGYGFAYRVLDAQYFGVAQRRRRVFVVGCLGDWRSPAAVLLERESLLGNPAPSREKGQVASPCLRARANSSHRADSQAYVPVNDWPAEIASTLNAAFGKKMGLENQHINEGAPLFVPGPIAFTARDYGNDASVNLAPTMRSLSCGADGHQSRSHGLAIAAFKGGQGEKAGGIGWSEHVAPTLSAGDSGTNRTPTLMQGMQVRRLTPIECERLQGFPDGYTNAPHRGKPAADGPRYKALGNSMAVPVMRWIGERIQMVEEIAPARAAA